MSPTLIGYAKAKLHKRNLYKKIDMASSNSARLCKEKGINTNFGHFGIGMRIRKVNFFTTGAKSNGKEVLNCKIPTLIIATFPIKVEKGKKK